jgi:hypothetical protein
MLPRILQLHPSTYQRLVRLSKEAERDRMYRVAKRLQAVLLNSQGRTSGELAEILRAPRSKVSEWLARYQAHGLEGLLEGQRSGRPAQLTLVQRQQLGRYSRQWAGGLRLGYGSVDLTQDCLGPAGRVRSRLSSRPCTQAAARNRFFRAASQADPGPGRSRSAGPLAPPNLSQS